MRIQLFVGADDDRLRDAVSVVVDALMSSFRPDPCPQTGSAEFADPMAGLDPLPVDGAPLVEVMSELRGVLGQGVRPDHPWCAAHLHAPPLLNAVVAEVAIAATNQSMDSVDQAPTASLVEDRLVQRLAELMGLPMSASGVLTAGGTSSNLLGLVLARQRAFPGANDTGVPQSARGWRIIASEAAHVSVRQAAAVMGLGRDAVVSVPTDDDGRMDVGAIHRVLSSRNPVLAIVGTAGTTDTGAVDPLPALADAARRHGAWFHVDAAVGGAFATSDRLRPWLSGIERADSVTVDLHKLWWQPLAISALLVADSRSWHGLRESADYLNRADDDAANLVDRSLDTSRRFDALKAVVSLRTTGRRELAEMVEHVVTLTQEAGQHVRRHGQLELLCAPQTVTVLFRCRPPGVSSDRLDDLNVAVQRELFRTGRAVIGRTRHRGLVALKLTLVNPTATHDDIASLLDHVATTAVDLGNRKVVA